MKKPVIASVSFILLSACISRQGPPEGYMMPYRPSLMTANAEQQPTPSSSADLVANASLWTTTPNALLSTRRATDVGHILTVVVDMNDQASLRNSLSRSRDSSEDLSIEALFGLPEWAQTIMPNGSSFSPAVDIDRESELSGNGAADRAEQIAFRLAARVVGIESNGNLIIQGYQETRVGNEVRYLTIMGAIRGQDITRDNAVAYDKIADAQISYISKGPATGNVQRKIGAKALDVIVPF